MLYSTTLTGNSTTKDDKQKVQKEVMRKIKHHFFCRRVYKNERLTDVSGVISKAVAMFIPLPAIAFATGTMAAEGRLAPEVIKEKINRVKDGIADKVKKENATEK